MNRRHCLKLMTMAPLALMVPVSFASPQVWSRGAAMPLKTQEIYPTAYQNEIIVAGGIASKVGAPYFTDRCVAYSIATNTWREHSQLPEARHHAALVSADSRLFLIGGFNGGYSHVWRMRDSVLEYTNGEWMPISSLPKNHAEGVIATSTTGRIHVVTGQSTKGKRNSKRSHHHEIHDHWSWNPNETSWQEHAPIPTARNSATGAWIDDEFLVAGGRTALGNMNSLEIYNLKTDAWRKARPMPLPQAGTASVAVNDGLIVFGGEIFKPKSGVFKEVWRYSLSKDSWEALEPLPTPRHGLGAVCLGSKVYVMGGATKPSGSGTSNVLEILDISLL